MPLFGLIKDNKVDKSHKKGRKQWTEADRLRAAETREAKQNLKRRMHELNEKRLDIAERRLLVDEARLKAQEARYLNEADEFKPDDDSDDSDDDDSDDNDNDDFDNLAKEAIKSVMKHGTPGNSANDGK